MINFSPAEDKKAFRTALSRFSTGVTVVTANTPQGPIGITANSFSSLSLSPALIMWAPAKQSSRYDGFLAATHFAVHILAFKQKAICDAFTASKSKFDGFDHAFNEHNVPILHHCLAVFECTKHAVHDAGDHSIIVGEVYNAQENAGEALIFAQGRFTSLNAESGSTKA